MWSKTGAALLAFTLLGTRALSAGELWDLKSYEMPNGKLDLQRLQRDYQNNQNALTKKIAAPVTANVSAWRAIPPTAPVTTPLVSKAEISPPAPTTSLIFLLRKDFTDINLFSAPISNQSATGAQFSLTQDAIARNTTWMADGTAAVAYTYFVEDIRNPFIGVTVAPYVTAHRDIYSATPSQNVDQVTSGISGEIGAKSPFFPNRSDYLRGSAAEMQDYIKATTVTHGQLEWLPTYTWVAGTIPGTFLNYNFTPELESQFDSTNAPGKTILFSGQKDSLRVGPMATLWFKLDPPGGALLPDYLKRFYGSVTYHWWEETYSRRTNNWLDASLHYNFDEPGHLAVAFSYQRGQTEDTGASTNVYQVTLTAKTCGDVLSGTSC